MYQSISLLFVGGHVHIIGGEHRVVMPRFEVTSIYMEWWCLMYPLYHQMGHEANPSTANQATGWQRMAENGSGTSKIYHKLGFPDFLNGARMPGSSLLHWKTLVWMFCCVPFYFWLVFSVWEWCSMRTCHVACPRLDCLIVHTCFPSCCLLYLFLVMFDLSQAAYTAFVL